MLLEHPVEVCVSKMFHRARTLKVRDIFDIAVVDRSMSGILSENLLHLSAKKGDLLARLDEMTASYYAKEMEEIGVLLGWEDIPAMAFDRIREIVEIIHEPIYRS